MTTTTHTNRTSNTSDTGRTARGAGPVGAALLGTMVVTAAFVALIVAGLAAADLFGTGGDAADRGVWMATQAWATPLALTGLAVLFAGAVPLALSNIRSSISTRRDSIVSGLPVILANTSIDHRENTTNLKSSNVNTSNKENIR